MRYFELEVEYYLIVATHQLKGIMGAVITEIIQWTLKLEADGILGEGMRFSDAEKSRAVKNEDKLTPTFILNFIGRMDHSQIQQYSPGASQR